jgi:hypothetical protein
MLFPCTIAPTRPAFSVVATAREDFHASQRYRRACAHVVGSEADHRCGRSASGEAWNDQTGLTVGLAVREVTRTHDAIDINTGAATSDLSGKACSPHGVHWSFDT